MSRVPIVRDCMASWWVTLRHDMHVIEAADLLFWKKAGLLKKATTTT